MQNSNPGAARDVLLIYAHLWQPEHDRQTPTRCHTCETRYGQWVVNFAQGLYHPIELDNLTIQNQRRFNLLHHGVIVEQDAGDYAFHPVISECDGCFAARLDRWHIAVRGQSLVKAMRQTVDKYNRILAILITLRKDSHQPKMAVIPENSLDMIIKACRGDIRWRVITAQKERQPHGK